MRARRNEMTLAEFFKEYYKRQLVRDFVKLALNAEARHSDGLAMQWQDVHAGTKKESCPRQHGVGCGGGVGGEARTALAALRDA